MLGTLRGRIIPFEIMVAALEVDILLVEDGSPLKRGGVLQLASRAMAKLAREWNFATQFEFHSPAMAVSLVFCLETLTGLVDTVWCSVLKTRKSMVSVGL